MRTFRLPPKFNRTAALCCFCVVLLTSVASGADAAKDPLGWGGAIRNVIRRIVTLRGKAQFRKALPLTLLYP